MTTYNYLCEMQELCFRAREALKATNQTGLEDFYSAAEEGFAIQLERLPVQRAKEPINQSQIESYLRVKSFAEDAEREAAEKIREETEAAKCQKKMEA